VSLLQGAVRLQEPLDQVLVRYQDLDTLIAKALASIAAGDRGQALILAAGVVGKCITLDSKLGIIDVRDGGGQDRPPGIFNPRSPATSRRRRRTAGDRAHHGADDRGQLHGDAR
jgi:hypothetical protein